MNRSARSTSPLQLYRRPLGLAAAILLLCGASRVALSLAWGERIPEGGWGFILLQGLRFDLILVGILLGPVAVLRPLLQLGEPGRDLVSRWGARLLSAWAGVAAVFVILLEGSTAPFIGEYGTRPNYLYVEYLQYPREVLSMLSGTHLVALIGVWAVALTGGWLAARYLRRDPAWSLQVRPSQCAWLVPLALVLTVGLVRSTLDHRPVNPSTAVFTGDSLVNQLPLNSPYSLLYALYEHRRDGVGGEIPYGHLDDGVIERIVLREAGLRHGQAARARPIPSLRHQQPTRELEQPLNFVIILMESVGADHVGSLGGKDLTPHLDALRDEGFWFDRLYATGVRSARGIEAVLTGFTPTHLNPVIKLSATQQGFFSLADLLSRQGYRTEFIYGGESHFDNMGRFFLNNGFQHIIDEKDYPDPIYFGGWGVSDEDLFQRTHEELMKHGDKPFFSLVFTSSNHEPFDIPAGRVTPIEGPDGGRETAIAYTDYALGQFLEQARKAPYWDRTVFLVVADHSAHKWGGDLVPVERFRIPGVFIGDQVPAHRVPGITSQIDLLPTALSLIGLSAEHPAIGRDITRPEFAQGAGRAMMQFHQLQAWVEDDWVIVLQPDFKPRSFKLGDNEEWIWDNSAPGRLKRKALAHALWGPLVIRKQAYALP